MYADKHKANEERAHNDSKKGSPREPPKLDKLGSGNPYHGNPQNLLRAFRGTLFPVHRTVIHSLAAASLPRQMEVVVTFVEKRPHPSRQKRLVHFVCFCTASTPVSLRLGHGSALLVHRTNIHYLAAASLPTGEGIRLCGSFAHQKASSSGQQIGGEQKRDLHLTGEVDRRCRNNGQYYTSAARRRERKKHILLHK